MSPNPYVVVLRRPGALRFSAAGILGRFEIAMGSLGVVLLVTGTGGSYTFATVLTAAHALSTAAFNPFISRLVDRHGQRRVVLPQVAVYVPAVVGLVLAVHAGAPAPVLIALAVIEGGAHPMVSGLVRARWSAILRGTTELKTAFAWESMLDALIVAVGAPLATLLAVHWFPASALLVAAGTLGVSVLLLAALRGTEPPPVPVSPERGRPGRSIPAGIVTMTVVSFALGANLGAFDIAALARADELGHTQIAGWILAVYAVGSTIGGVVAGRYGTGGSLPRQHALLLAGLSAGVLPMVFLAHAVLLISMAFLAGVFIAPTIIASMTIVEAIAPAGRITECLAWTGVGLISGRAAGQLGAGVLADRVGAGAAFALVSATAAAGFAVAAARAHRLSGLITPRVRLEPADPVDGDPVVCAP